MRRTGRLWLLLWLGVVVGGYYALHPPLGPRALSACGVALARLGLTGLGVALAGGLGRRLLPALPTGGAVTTAVVQAAVGLGLLGTGMLALAAFGGLRPGLLAALGLAGLLGLAPSALAWLRAWGTLPALVRRAGVWGALAAGALAWASALSLALALAPPLQFDALVYHLAFPARYLAQGRFTFIPSFFWGMPQLAEMHYAWAMGLLGPQAATVLGWWVSLLVTLGVVGLAADWVHPLAGWVAGWVLLTGRTWWEMAAWGYVDQWAALFGLSALALLAAAQADRATAQRWAAWAGAVAGWAMGVKYTGGSLALLGGAWLFVAAWRQARGRRGASHSQISHGRISHDRSLSHGPAAHGRPVHHNALSYSHASHDPASHSQENALPPYKPLLTFLLIALLTFSPWLLKNLWATGNPLYPFLKPAGAVDALRLRHYLLPPFPWPKVLALPFLATWQGREGGGGYAASIGPWLLALIPFAWSARRRHTVFDLTAWVGLGGVLLWAGAALADTYLAQSRLHFAIFPALALLAAWGFAALRAQRGPLPQIFGGLLTLSVLLALAQYTAITVGRQAPEAVLGQITPQAYLEHNLGPYAQAMEAIRQLPPERRVLLLWEPREFYCLPHCTGDEILDRFWHAQWRYATPEAILDAWRQAGYTEVLVSRVGVTFLREQNPDLDWAAWEAFRSRLRPRQSFGEAYTLYALP